MREQINLSGAKVTPVLQDDIHDLMKNGLEVVSPFMKVLWKEQKKYLFINPKARKYHSMVIRFCLSLGAKFPSVMTNRETQIFLYYLVEEHLEITKMLYSHMQGSINQLLLNL